MKVIEKNATVYKLVTRRGNTLLSWIEHALPKPWVVEYRPGEWTYPIRKGSKLFAYAKEKGIWIGHHDEVWRAEADIVDGELGHGERVLRTEFWHSARSLAAFWRNPAKYPERFRGTAKGVWCSRIRLEERVS